MVIILGMPRSGTTLLSALLSISGRYCVIEEPNVVWRYRNWASLGHDEFSIEHATPSVKSYIRRRFEQKIARSGKPEILEKTPTNCLRPDFVRAIFPHAKYIVLTREKSSVIQSIIRKRVDEYDLNGIYLGDERPLRQLRLQIRRFATAPIVDMPYYFSIGCRELVFHILGVKRSYWGPQFCGWRDSLSLAIEEQVELQWQAMDRCLNQVFESWPTESYLSISYEDLTEKTENTCRNIERFLELPRETLVAASSIVRRSER